MPLLPALLNAATLAAAGATAAYTAVLAAVALTSVLSPAPEIRRDARATLTILLRRRRRG